jgi:hypothetical protein
LLEVATAAVAFVLAGPTASAQDLRAGITTGAAVPVGGIMRFILMAASASIVALALPAPGLAQAEVQRFVLAAGANSGGSDRPLLRYAVSDAERFSQVLTELGGVDPANVLLLKEPKVRDLIQGLDQLNRRAAVTGRPAGGGRTEVLVYCSGHADEKGLLLGDDRYSYQSLRDRLQEIPADVRIAVLDACASGAFTRLKGASSLTPLVSSRGSSRNRQEVFHDPDRRRLHRRTERGKR